MQEVLEWTLTLNSVKLHFSWSDLNIALQQAGTAIIRLQQMQIRLQEGGHCSQGGKDTCISVRMKLSSEVKKKKKITQQENKNKLPKYVSHVTL